MGVTPERDPGPGKTDRGVGKKETSKTKPRKGKTKSLVPLGKAAPQECVGSQTRDRAHVGSGLVTKIADSAILNESSGKTYARAAHDDVGQVQKSRSLLHLTSKE